MVAGPDDVEDVVVVISPSPLVVPLNERFPSMLPRVIENEMASPDCPTPPSDHAKVRVAGGPIGTSEPGVGEVNVKSLSETFISKEADTSLSPEYAETFTG